MKRFLLFFVIVFCVSLLPGQSNWQQKVDYKMDVALNVEERMLSGEEWVTYTNNSPDTMNDLYFHLTANAFSSKKSQFAKSIYCTTCNQMILATKAQMGGYTCMDFSTEGEALRFEYRDSAHEIVRVYLKQPLEPGQSVTIQVPICLKIPDIILELRKYGSDFQLHGWYPSPFAYDKEGWHLVPYGFQGVNYAEFGDYDVSITLPADYFIASTGQIDNAREQVRLNKRKALTQVYLDSIRWDTLYDVSRIHLPKAGRGMKKVHLTAHNVNDFTWYASPDYLVTEEEITINEGKKVRVSCFFLPKKAFPSLHANDFIKESIRYYSGIIGPYPWDQMTVVVQDLFNVYHYAHPGVVDLDDVYLPTDLKRDADRLIAAQWFSCAVNADGYRHIWQYQGLAEFMYRYHRREKDGEAFYNDEHEGFFAGQTDIPEYFLNVITAIRTNRDQKPDLPVDQYTLVNLSYHKFNYPAHVFNYLAAYIGPKAMFKSMHDYYDKFRFGHPSPSDLQKVLEDNTGKELDWVFSGLFCVGHNRPLYMDYALEAWKDKANNIVTISNKGDVAAPVLVQGMRDGKVVSSQWVEGFNGTKVVKVEGKDLDAVELDHDRISPDIRPENQRLRKGVFPRMRPLKLSVFPVWGLQTSRTNILLIPAIGYNYNDGFMLGAVIHNYSALVPRWKYFVAPMYGFKSKHWVGMGELNYNYYPRGMKLRHLRAGVFYRRFSPTQWADSPAGYTANSRMTPYIQSYFKSGPLSLTEHYFRVSYDRYMFAGDEEKGPFGGPASQRLRLRYRFEKDHSRFPLSFSAGWQLGKYGAKREQMVDAALSGEINLSEYIAVDYRLFEGYVLGKEDGGLKGGYYLTATPSADNMYLDNYYFKRTPEFRQVLTNSDGGFKDPIIVKAGSSLTALNLMASVPHFSSVKLFVDQALVLDEADQTPNYYLSAGVGFEVEKFLGLYFPFYNIGLSPYYQTQHQGEKPGLRSLSFMLRLKWNLLDIVSEN